MIYGGSKLNASLNQEKCILIKMKWRLADRMTWQGGKTEIKKHDLLLLLGWSFEDSLRDYLGATNY